MIVKKIQDIKHEEDFIREHSDDTILLINHYTNDFYMIKEIICKCRNLSTDLQVEVGGNFFLIRKMDSGENVGCKYWLSDRILSQITNI